MKSYLEKAIFIVFALSAFFVFSYNVSASVIVTGASSTGQYLKCNKTACVYVDIFKVTPDPANYYATISAEGQSASSDSATNENPSRTATVCFTVPNMLSGTSRTIVYSVTSSSGGTVLTNSESYYYINCNYVDAVCGPAATATYSYSGSTTTISTGLCNAGMRPQINPILPATQGSSVSWTCAGINDGDSITCTARRAVNGTCGSTAKQYSPTEAWPTSGYCSSGNSIPENPSNPSQGGSTNWTCEAAYGGVPANCTATRRAPINGSCGSAARFYSESSSSTTISTNLCSSGTPPAINPVLSAVGGSTVTWTCSGIDGGQVSPVCTASRVTSGICGSAAKSYSPTEVFPGSNTYCSSGNVNPENPTNPSAEQASYWYCISPDGGSTSNCIATRRSPINGACGSAIYPTTIRNYNGLSTTISTNLCSSGTPPINNPILPAAEGSTVSWTCEGIEGGLPASCTAIRATDGVCGSTAKQYSPTEAWPVNNYCATGSASPASPPSPSQGGSTTWSCIGLDGGKPASCTATRRSPINGACGIATTPPTTYSYTGLDTTISTNLCSVGTRPTVDPILPAAQGSNVTWNCSGIEGGNPATCVATRSFPPAPATNGSCGTANKTYTVGSTSFGSDIFCASGNSTPSNPAFPTNLSPITSWTCSGTNGGTPVSCSASLVVNAVCGTANKTYYAGSTSFGSDTKCSFGNPNPANPVFPTISDTKTTWTCLGINGGAPVNCEANLIAYGVCGNGATPPAKWSYTGSETTIPSQYLCGAGTPSSSSVVLPAAPGSTNTWKCSNIGIAGYSSCTARRSIDGVCGPASRVFLQGEMFPETQPYSGALIRATTGVANHYNADDLCKDEFGQEWIFATIDNADELYMNNNFFAGSYIIANIPSASSDDPWNGKVCSGELDSWPEPHKEAIFIKTSTSFCYGDTPKTENHRVVCKYISNAALCSNSIPPNPAPSLLGNAGGSTTTWTCPGAYGGTPSECMAIRATNGVCGTASGRIYPVGSTDFGSYSICSSGNLYPPYINFPNNSYPETWWTCEGANGGTSDYFCVAKLKINGICGTANGKTYTQGGLCQVPTPWIGVFELVDCPTGYGGDTQCSAGYSTNTVFPSIENPTVTWKCTGANGGTTSATCTAKLAVDASCGSAVSPAPYVNPYFSFQQPCTGHPDFENSCTNYLYTGSNTTISQNLCATGNKPTTNPVLPATMGSSVGWTCSGINGGQPATCTARRATNGVCGTANKTYPAGSTSFGTDTLCAKGEAHNRTWVEVWGITEYPINFPTLADPASTSWACIGLDGGTNNHDCIAKLKVNGVCGPATTPPSTYGYWQQFAFGDVTNVGETGITEQSCSAGIPPESVVVSGVPGVAVNWTCSGINGGASSATCTARRAIHGECKLMNGSWWDATYSPIADDSWRPDSIELVYGKNTPWYTGPYCAMGTQSGTPVDPAVGGSTTWSCVGSYGGRTESCRAVRLATLCGPATYTGVVYPYTGSVTEVYNMCAKMVSPLYTWLPTPPGSRSVALCGEIAKEVCTIHRRLDGVCGTASSSYSPTENFPGSKTFCTYGTATTSLNPELKFTSSGADFNSADNLCKTEYGSSWSFATIDNTDEAYMASNFPVGSYLIANIPSASSDGPWNGKVCSGELDSWPEPHKEAIFIKTSTSFCYGDTPRDTALKAVCRGYSVTMPPADPVIGGSTSWICLGGYGGTNTTCSASRRAPVNGVCGPATTPPTNYDYTGNATNISSFNYNTYQWGNLCSAGAGPFEVPLPAAQGSSVSWICAGTDGGIDSQPCIATRATNAICGSAAKKYADGETFPSGSYCSVGTPSPLNPFAPGAQAQSLYYSGTKLKSSIVSGAGVTVNPGEQIYTIRVKPQTGSGGSHIVVCSEGEAQYPYYSGTKLKSSIVSGAGVTVNPGEQIYTIRVKPQTGSGGSYVVSCPTGTNYRVCVENNNDGAGEYVLLGVKTTEVQSLYYSGTKLKTFITSSAGVTVNPGEQIYTILVKPQTGSGGSYVVSCPTGTNYRVCVENNNDGNGEYVLLGVKTDDSFYRVCVENKNDGAGEYVLLGVGIASSWTCQGIAGGDSSVCAASRIPINGVCGSAAKPYAEGEVFPSGSYCSVGTANPLNPLALGVEVQSSYYSGTKLKSSIVSGAGVTVNSGEQIYTIRVKPQTGSGGSYVITCPIGTNYRVCVENKNDGAGEYVFLGVGIASSWTCQGIAGGDSSVCAASRIPINGVCGSAAKLYAEGEVFPSGSYCSVGTANPLVPSNPIQGGSTSWSCIGLNGGNPVSCTASRSVNGACGTANKIYPRGSTSFGSDTFCAKGTISANPTFPTNLNTTASWTCSGTNGGTPASCSASLVVDGTCGYATTPPSVYLETGSSKTISTNLCSTGTNPSPVILPADMNSTVTWTCGGINGGNPSSTCSAIRATNGICGSAAKSYSPTEVWPAGDYCSEGTLSATPENPAVGGSSTWSCIGSFGGTSPSCAAIRRAPIAGTCGYATSPPVNYIYNGSQLVLNNLCLSGKAPISPVILPAPIGSSVTWICSGIDGGQDSSTCLASRAAVDGVCGSASKIYSRGSTSFGSDTFCDQGTVGPVSPTFPTNSSPIARWVCNGINGGAVPTCSAILTTDGACGSATTPPTLYPFYSTSSQYCIPEGTDIIYPTYVCVDANPNIISNNLCASGVPSVSFINLAPQNDGSNVSWTCNGTGDGQDSNICTAARPANGVCGSAITPTTIYKYTERTTLISNNLCSSGFPSDILTGNIYNYRVSAINAIGTSSASTSSSCNVSDTITNGVCGVLNGKNLSYSPIIWQDKALVISGALMCISGSPSVPQITLPFTSGVVSWTCSGSNGGTNATCSTSRLTTNGFCGSANKTYSRGSTSFGTDTLCDQGKNSPASPVFPTSLSPITTWTCNGENNGASSSCKAILEVNGTCGTNAKIHSYTGDSTMINSNLCSSGLSYNSAGTATITSVTLAANGGSTISWKCVGAGAGHTDVDCTATRETVNGTCGNNAKTHSYTGSSTVLYSNLYFNLCSSGQPYDSAGTATITSVTLAADGDSTVSWKCVGAGAGHTDVDCTATRESLNGTCGADAKTFSYIYYSWDTSLSSLCSSGISYNSAGTATIGSVTLRGVEGSTARWKCVGTGIDHTDADCAAIRAFVNGTCGADARVHLYTGSSTIMNSNLCSSGLSYNSAGTVTIPSVTLAANGGSTVSWKCVGAGTGHTDADCTATRREGANGTCGTAAKTYPYPSSSTIINSDLCSSGTAYNSAGTATIIYVTLGGNPGLTVSWKCVGGTGFTDADCAAIRETANGTCGTNAKTYSYTGSSTTINSDLCSSGLSYDSAGTAYITSVTLAADGGSTASWKCVGAGTGHTDADCTATRVSQ